MKISAHTVHITVQPKYIAISGITNTYLMIMKVHIHIGNCATHIQNILIEHTISKKVSYLVMYKFTKLNNYIPHIATLQRFHCIYYHVMQNYDRGKI